MTARARIEAARAAEVAADEIGFASAALRVLGELDDVLDDSDLSPDERAFIEAHREDFAQAVAETLERRR